MKVILTKDLDNLGRAGALVEVKPGYGRNYLLPRNLAVLATAKNIRQLDHQKAGILSRAAKDKQNMSAMAQKLSAVEVRLSRKVGEQNKLFGSVTSKDIHEQLVNQGYQVERKQIHLPEPLKELGTH
ncbi:MAG TPA: 50S ribosomal protein L9, partial [Myxococcales bacterium]|nr:50S ribosomal protein L9 [Myxococcales bacterium]